MRSTLVVALVVVLFLPIAAWLVLPDVAAEGADVAPHFRLGEAMHGVSHHFASLWFCGTAGNWERARYEFDEIEEGLADVVAAQVRKNDQDVSALVRKMTDQGFGSLKAAIAARDVAALETGYKSLVLACNSCHQTVGYGFLRVCVPTEKPSVNEIWEPEAKK